MSIIFISLCGVKLLLFFNLINLMVIRCFYNFIKKNFLLLRRGVVKKVGYFRVLFFYCMLVCDLVCCMWD